MLLKDVLYDDPNSTRSWFIRMPLPNQNVMMLALLNKLEPTLMDLIDTYPYAKTPQDLTSTYFVRVFTPEVKEQMVEFIDAIFPEEELIDKFYFMLMSIDLVMDHTMRMYAEEYRRRCSYLNLGTPETEEQFIRRIQNN